jgi:hypothetical protein
MVVLVVKIAISVCTAKCAAEEKTMPRMKETKRAEFWGVPAYPPGEVGRK